MKKIIISFLFLGIFLSSDLLATPYYRFWRGWKLDTISDDQFENSLNDIFVPATIEVGSGRGLLAYLPILTPKLSDRESSVAKLIPDEVALVIYKSEEEYRALRATPQGQAYGALHWDYFDREKGSTSLVPLPFTGQLEVGQAYDVLQGDADWQKGAATYSISWKRENPLDYVNTMKNEFSTKGLVSYLVLVAEHYVIEYQLWENVPAIEEAAMDVLKIQSKSLQLLEGSFGAAKPVQPYNANLHYRGGINVQFPF